MMKETEGSARKRSRRLRYRRISADWGKEEIDTKTMSFLQSGLEGTKGLALSSWVQVTVTPAEKLDRAESVQVGRKGGDGNTRKISTGFKKTRKTMKTIQWTIWVEGKKGSRTPLK